MWKKFLHEYLSFTKKERRGIFILLGLIISCLLIPFLYPLFLQSTSMNYSKIDSGILRLKKLQADTSAYAYQEKTRNREGYRDDYNGYDEPFEKKYPASSKGELFYFDPNTATVNDWIKLGIRPKTAETIQKYVSKGGHFNKPEDIAKIWGLHADEVSRLLPFVRIETADKRYPKNETAQFKNYLQSHYEKKTPEAIDINSSDTSGFISLPGIGNKLAQRIIAFRDKLGGFYSVDQVKETYGLPDSTFQKIKSQLIISSQTVKRININTASVEELRSHPYIRYNLANVFIQYRKQHGSFTTIADIKKIMIVTDEIFEKVAPYLTTDQ